MGGKSERQELEGAGHIMCSQKGAVERMRASAQLVLSIKLALNTDITPCHLVLVSSCILTVCLTSWE